MTVHSRMWPCAAAAVCNSCTLGATPGCTNWRHGAFPSTALAELHPGEGPGQQPSGHGGCSVGHCGSILSKPVQAWIGLIVLAISQRVRAAGQGFRRVPEGFQKFQCRWQVKVPEGSARFRKVPESSGADARSRLRRLWRFRRVPAGFGTFRCRCEPKVPGFLRKVPQGSGKFRCSCRVQVPEVPEGSGKFRWGKVREVLEGSERGPRISGADAYCHVKDELHERGLVPQEG